MLCSVMKVSRSAYYSFLRQGAVIITAKELRLYRLTRKLFNDSRASLGSRQLAKQLRKEGFNVGRYKVIRLMKKLNLRVKQRVSYKITTKRKHSDAVADNVLQQQFNPPCANMAWAGDVTYLRTKQGWMYCAIMMDLYSRRIIGWAIEKRMTKGLVIRAMKMAMVLRGCHRGLIFHSDRGSQYTSNEFQTLLKNNNITPSMSSKGACLDNVVVERFFGSLKHEWLLNVVHLTRDSMKRDVEAYIKYYNRKRLHTSLGDLTPIEYENSFKKVCGLT